MLFVSVSVGSDEDESTRGAVVAVFFDTTDFFLSFTRASEWALAQTQYQERCVQELQVC